MKDNIENSITGLYFDVDSQIIGELGERLVTNNYVALSELIKNSYDADSSAVEIKFHNITRSSDARSEIIIRDNGHGMTFDQIDKYWMTIATSNKLQEPRSAKYGRPKTGNKGVGRFACQKLANILILESVAKISNGYEKTVVTFNWSDFKPGMNLNKIPCQYEKTTSKTGRSGVTLKLLDLRDSWSERDFKMLLKSIALISVATPLRREKYNEDLGFSVTTSSDEFDSGVSLVSENILNSGWGKLEGSVLSDGALNLILDSKGSSKQKYKIDLKNKNLAGLRFVIYILPGDSKYDYIDSRRNPTILTKNIRSNIWAEESGIKVYYDSFRIYPYGDISSGDDWLDIAKDIGRRRGPADDILKDVGKQFSTIPSFNFSRAMLNHPAAQAHVGSVYIEGETTKAFSAKMDREGLVENKNLFDLKKIIRISTDWSALHYEAFIRSNVSTRNDIMASKFDEAVGVTSSSKKERIENAIEYLRESLKNDNKTNINPAESSGETDYSNKPEKSSANASDKEGINRAVSYIDSQFDEYAAELDTLRSVASTAPLMFVFSHEVKGIVSGLLNHSSRLRDLAKKCQDSKISDELIEMAEQAKNSVARYTKLIKLFDIFSDSQNFSKKKAKVKDAVENIVDGFEFLLSTFNITVGYTDVSRLLKIPKLNEAQMYSLIINALTNSIKAVIVKNSKRKIYIDITIDENNVTIAFSDTGVGLGKRYWETVFKPFESDPEGKIYSVLSNSLEDEQLATLGKGSGLGLHIMKNIIVETGGRVYFSTPSRGWSTCLIMELPK